MYRHFKGKDDLIEAYLALEDAVIEAYLALEDAVIRGYFEDAAAHAGPDTDMLELVIDGIAGDIERYHTRGCPFINAAAEYPDPDSRVRQLITAHRSWFRGALEQA